METGRCHRLCKFPKHLELIVRCFVSYDSIVNRHKLTLVTFRYHWSKAIRVPENKFPRGVMIRI